MPNWRESRNLDKFGMRRKEPRSGVQNIATAEGRGFRLGKTKPRQGRKIFQARQSFAPDGAMSGRECKRDSAQPSKNWFSTINAFPRPSAVATFLRRLAAENGGLLTSRLRVSRTSHRHAGGHVL